MSIQKYSLEKVPAEAESEVKLTVYFACFPEYFKSHNMNELKQALSKI